MNEIYREACILCSIAFAISLPIGFYVEAFFQGVKLKKKDILELSLWGIIIGLSILLFLLVGE